MKDIILGTCRLEKAKLRIIAGPRPYLGVEIKDPKTKEPSRWYYIRDKDLWRLEKAIKKCIESYKKHGKD